MLEALREIETKGLAELEAAADAGALESWRVSYLGTKGRLRAAHAIHQTSHLLRKGLQLLHRIGMAAGKGLLLQPLQVRCQLPHLKDQLRKIDLIPHR